MKLVYLDNNATTPLDPGALETMLEVSTHCFGNPGSRHAAGRKARQVLEDSREEIASILDALPSEVIFTSGGSESSNLALRGLTRGRTGVIALPAGEHPATEQTVKRLATSGFRRQTIPVASDGRISEDVHSDWPPEEMALVTAMLAHNETGTIQNLTPLAKWCAEHRIPFHVDAVQAVGKIPVKFHELNCTSLSLGAHKFHGPRGIGALLVQEKFRIVPELLGGHQEHGRRAGTEPVALIAGMARALSNWNANAQSRWETMRRLRDQLEFGFRERCAPVSVIGSQNHRLPNTLNVAFPGCDAEAMLVALDLAGICCSQGSTCSSGSSEPAPILTAMNCPPEVIRSSLRFSISVQNTQAEIQFAITRVAEVVERLRQGR